MAGHADARRRALAAHGRPMILRRTATPPVAPVALLGFARAYAPGEIMGGVQQGDMSVETTADELLAAGFPLPPRNPDRLTVDGRSFTVMGARGIYDAGALIGFSLWIRGA